MKRATNQFVVRECQREEKRSEVAVARSADFQSAVSPSCTRQGRCGLAAFSKSRRLRIANPRNGRLQICATSALTLLEMMVAVTLLAVIMVGLLMMFNQTQKALHIASQQSDVFEATRATVQMISRDLTEVSDFNRPGVINCYSTNLASPLGGGGIALPFGTNQLLNFGEAFWLTRANDQWTGVGYYVVGTNSGIGTLYRFFEPTDAAGAPQLLGHFFFYTNSPVMEGVVHFAMSAVYVTNHSGFADNPSTSFERAGTFEFPFSYVETNSVGTNKIPVTTRIALPAFIDIEFGVLEPAALRQYQTIAAATPGTAVAQNFLLNHVGQVHFFRERVPVRNFVNPYRAHEAP